MTLILTPIFFSLLLLESLSSFYLAALASFALTWRSRLKTLVVQKHAYLGIIVPAHNEERLLPRLLASLRAQSYPASYFSVHVVADNCTDRTAEIARNFGCDVHERFEPDCPGKGQAIAWLLGRLRNPAADAYVFVDADSVVEHSFLETINRYLGTRVALQVSYRVAEPDSAPLVTLRALGFAMMHEVRGRAKAVLGLSSGLWGNGMVLTREALDRVPWQSFSAVEDAEEHLLLVIHGIRVDFVPETSVYGHMPATFEAAKGQQRRWEAGRLALLRRYWRRLLFATLTGNSSAALTFADLILPPLSIILFGDLVVLTIARFYADRLSFAVSLASILGVIFYVVIGCSLSGIKPCSYRALVWAPGYILWKICLYGKEFVRRVEPGWIRTARDGPA